MPSVIEPEAMLHPCGFATSDPSPDRCRLDLVRAVNSNDPRGPAGTRRDPLVLALETAAPDVVVVLAATLASLRRDDWQIPASIERLAGVVSLSQRADRAGAHAKIGATVDR